MDLFTASALIFLLVNIVNVMLCTVKSVFTIKASRGIATLANAVAFGFYAMIVKLIANQPMEIVVSATIIANLIGVYTSLWLLDKFSKDKVWKISVIASPQDYSLISPSLQACGIAWNKYKVDTKFGKWIGLDIFSNNQAESIEIKKILSYYPIKYHVVEIGREL